MTDDEIKEQFEPIPQDFPQLLLIAHSKVFSALEKNNFNGAISIVNGLVEQLKSFPDAEIDKRIQEIRDKYENKRQELKRDLRGYFNKYGFYPSFATDEYDQKNFEFQINEALEILGVISIKESKKGLQVEKTSVIGDEE